MAADTEAFRKEARDWLEANFPPQLRKEPDTTMEQMEGGLKPSEDAELWRKRMGEKGWGAPTWPKEYGGGGLSPAEARVLQQEMAAIGARNPIGGMGVMHVRPDPARVRHRGAEAAAHPADRAAASCAGARAISEPGAGSDLASLQTKAEDKGDHCLVNGQKIWTSGAQYADWCFCLVRTDPKAKKHEGISFLLIDMHSPGRRGAADQADHRRLALLRDLLHRREGAEGEPGRAAERRLDHRQAAAAARAQRHGQRRRRRRRAVAGRQPRSTTRQDSMSASTRPAASPTPTCAPRITAHKMEAQAFRSTVRRAAAEARGANSGPAPPPRS